MRGDRVEIVVDAGSELRTYDITATRNGRRVEVTRGRGIVEVSEVTRGGTTVRTARFMASRVVALVEFPAGDNRLADDEQSERSERSGRSGRSEQSERSEDADADHPVRPSRRRRSDSPDAPQLWNAPE